MNKALLITRPEHEPATRYLSRWSKEILEQAEKKGFRIIDLHRKKAERKRFIGTLKKSNPSLVFLNGHGNDKYVTGHQNEIILQMTDKKEVEDKIIIARSCNSAKTLGPRTLHHGAIAFLGYQEKFFLATEDKLSHPLEDKTAFLFLKPSNQLAISLLKGNTTSEANKKSKNLYKKNIAKILIKGSLHDNYRDIPFLVWNMKHQVCLGNQGATC